MRNVTPQWQRAQRSLSEIHLKNEKSSWENVSISETFEGLWNIISPPTWKWCQLPVQLAFFFSTSSLNGPPVVDLQRVNVFQDMFLFDILTYHTGIGCMNIYWRGLAGEGEGRGYWEPWLNRVIEFCVVFFSFYFPCFNERMTSEDLY